jgi:hypothetical protein
MGRPRASKLSALRLVSNEIEERIRRTLYARILRRDVLDSIRGILLPVSPNLITAVVRCCEYHQKADR